MISYDIFLRKISYTAFLMFFFALFIYFESLKVCSLNFEKVYSISVGSNPLADSSSYIIGTKQLRRSLKNKRLKDSRELAKARIEHRELDLEISKLDIPKHAHMQSELKQLKAEKLRIKDTIRHLMKEAGTVQEGKILELGSGGFGKVLFGHDEVSRRDVAIKIASPDDFSSLRTEYSILQLLKEETSFPKVHYFGKQNILDLGERVVLVMDVLGPSIERLLFATTLGVRGFSAVTVLRLAIELLGRLQILSKYDIVHGDIQPGNFLMGKGCRPQLLSGTTEEEEEAGYDYSDLLRNDNQTVYLIDFGLSHSSPSSTTTTTNTNTNTSIGPSPEFSSTHKHQAALNKKVSKELVRPCNGFEGTLGFSSVRVMQGEIACERDDLEALAYSLAYLLTGNLPWSRLLERGCQITMRDMGYRDLSTVSLVSEVKSFKDQCTFKDFFSSSSSSYTSSENTDAYCLLPDQLATADFIYSVLCHAKNLQPDQKPDYTYFRQQACRVLTDTIRRSSGATAAYDWESAGITWSSTDGVISTEGY